MRLPVVLLALTVACHSDAFAPAFYGATGPLNAGPEARLTFNTGDQYGHPFQARVPSWAADGSGIVYTFSPRPHQIGESLELVCGGSGCTFSSRDSQDTCLAMLPAQGGSAYWQMCETKPFHTDSSDIFASAAVSGTGRLLYIEMSGSTLLPFPLGLHAELWLGSSGNFAIRRQLMTLYHDHLGVDGTNPADVNWLSETTWLGTDEFLAIGGHLFPGIPDSLRPRGLVRGAISASGADVIVVPGTAADSIAHFALVDGGSAVLFVDSTAVIRRVVVASGSTSVVATLALSPTGKSLDIGCRPDACIVLTSDGSPRHWDLWKLDPASGALTLVRTFTHALTGAKLSPRSGDVVALEGDNLYFLANVLQ